MDVRPDTSSGRSQDGWSFLNQGNVASQDAQARSHPPPSSYIRSDRSTLSPLPNGHNTNNGSRSSFSRNHLSASTGARSTTTIPSQPVLLRINSQYDRNHRAPRPVRRPVKIMGENRLPALEEFSIQGILSAIREDIEPDLNTISEVLGRSRFMLADQYDSQLPPQGEIIMRSPLQGIEEVSASVEQLGTDNVLILSEEASLPEGSNSGSAAYRLMERLQVVPRPIRINSDAAMIPRAAPPDSASPVRTRSSPAVVQPEPEDASARNLPAVEQREQTARVSERGPARPVVSEMYLSAEANGIIPSTAPIVSESGRHYALYTHDDSGLFEPTSFMRTEPRSRRRLDAWLVPDFSSLASWFSRGHEQTDQSAEARLRGLLNR